MLFNIFPSEYGGITQIHIQLRLTGIIFALAEVVCTYRFILI